MQIAFIETWRYYLHLDLCDTLKNIIKMQARIFNIFIDIEY